MKHVGNKKKGMLADTGNWLVKARELERDGEFQKAAAAYEKVIKSDPTNEYAYDRLMILYRKNREYSKEKALINTGLKAFRELYKTTSRLPTSRKLTALSNALMKATGLADKRGKAIYEREPLGRWSKRLKVVERKLKG